MTFLSKLYDAILILFFVIITFGGTLLSLIIIFVVPMGEGKVVGLCFMVGFFYFGTKFFLERKLAKRYSILRFKGVPFDQYDKSDMESHDMYVKIVFQMVAFFLFLFGIIYISSWFS